MPNQRGVPISQRISSSQNVQISQTSTESVNAASQVKVREMAKKLGIPMSKELLSLKSNEAISDALIEQAIASGKSETDINNAMAQLW